MSTSPVVSIIIPYHDAPDITLPCINSIRANTSCEYELILVDDASSPETAQAIEAIVDRRTRVIRNESRLSFSANNNAAAKLARGHYLCLLNNDTLVTPGWLESMVTIFGKESRYWGAWKPTPVSTATWAPPLRHSVWARGRTPPTPTPPHGSQRPSDAGATRSSNGHLCLRPNPPTALSRARWT
jgi:glycosyltransferase involved in cell wall biosynthesis